MARVLDAGALLDFFRDEGVAADVENLLVRTEKAKQKVWITSLTWEELYYRALKGSEKTAERFTREMASLPVEVFLENEDLALSRQLARLRLTLTNADRLELHSLALAKLKKAELWTTSKDIARSAGDTKIMLLGKGGN